MEDFEKFLSVFHWCSMFHRWRVFLHWQMFHRREIRTDRRRRGRRARRRGRCETPRRAQKTPRSTCETTETTRCRPGIRGGLSRQQGGGIDLFRGNPLGVDDSDVVDDAKDEGDLTRTPQEATRAAMVVVRHAGCRHHHGPFSPAGD